MRRKNIMDRLLPEDAPDAICVNCIGDEVLRSLFSGVASQPCKLCNMKESVTTTGTLIANASRSIIQAHFKEFQHSDPAGICPLSLMQVLREVTGIADDKFCQGMADHIFFNPRNGDKEFFKHEKTYINIYTTSKPDSSQWNSISFDLVHRQRYFNKNAEDFFNILLNEAVSAKSYGLFGEFPAAEKIIPAGKILYRARRANANIKEEINKQPETELGAPPKKHAAHNRMNPSGISLFYSATEKETAIAEIRPSIGDTIALGKFETTRDLKLFDIRHLNVFPVQSKVSHWYDAYKETISCREFLSHLHDAISQPVLIGETGYLVTQAFTEYLCHRHDGKFDGIVFKSVQRESGANYVIFGEKLVKSEIVDESWEPKFPVKLSAHEFHKIDNIQYCGDWQ